MMSINAKNTFEFTVPGERNNVVYTYKPSTGNFRDATGTVVGGTIRDPILYSVERVNQALADGSWVPVEDQGEFPRAGVYAKLEGFSKVYIIGKATMGNPWVIETSNGTISKVHAAKLTRIGSRDEQAFAIVEDLGLSFHQALKMVDKGYAKQ